MDSNLSQLLHTTVYPFCAANLLASANFRESGPENPCVQCYRRMARFPLHRLVELLTERFRPPGL